MSTRIIEVNYLARVEGEGALHISIHQNRVDNVQLKIFEPPRFFEAFLQGRDYREAPDITARICGICPVAYLLGACQAMEAIAGVTLPPPLRALRRLLYCGEWIESHVLHIYMLHAPDFFGMTDAVALAKQHPELVKRALRMKKAGNSLMRLVGGREIHPVNVRVGGFYRAPDADTLTALIPELEWALDAALETVERMSAIDFPAFERDYVFMALRHPDEYPLTEGRLTTNTGIDLPVSEYDNLLEERHDSHSTALRSYTRDGGCLHLGPLARYAINHDKLTPKAADAAARAKLGPQVRNPFKSIVVRAVEVVFALEEALRIIREYRRPAQSAVDFQMVAGTGHGATEAPRGICYHRYSVDEAGLITDAKIVAPTSVNQRVIEADLYEHIAPNLHLSDDALRERCELAIRNYDPCISCSTHFLNLTVQRT